MTASEYKQAQRTLGFYGRNKLKGWLDTLGISDPTHKRYLSKGPSKTVARLINALLRIRELESMDK